MEEVKEVRDEIKTQAEKALRQYNTWRKEQKPGEYEGDDDTLQLMHLISQLGFDVVILFGSSIMIAERKPEESNPYFNRVAWDEKSGFIEVIHFAINEFLDWYF